MEKKTKVVLAVIISSLILGLSIYTIYEKNQNSIKRRLSEVELESIEDKKTEENRIKVEQRKLLLPKYIQTKQPTATRRYSCSYNAYNCDDFSTHNQAQRVFEYCGGINNDVHRLDRDKDGWACESL